MKRNLSLSLLVFLLIILAGCATTSVTHYPQLTWQQRSAKLNQLQSWTIKGAISIQTALALNMASITWDQHAQNYQLTIFGPLNLGSVKIVGSPSAVTLWKSNKAPITAATPELLMQETLGWQLPITHLYYWVRGLPAPKDSSTAQFDNAHRLIHLVQDGWDIQYLQFTLINNIDLPSKIVLTNAQLRVKLAFHQWRVNACR